MSFRTILVCIESEECVEPLVSMAYRAKGSSDVRVVGVHTIPGTNIYPSVSAHIPVSLYQDINRKHSAHAASIKLAFEKAITRGKARWEWYEYDGEHLFDYRPYINLALTSDIVVTKKPDPILSEIDLQRDLLLESGTPVLMVPVSEQCTLSNNIGPQRIAIAWNATAESARAVRIAMPFLTEAERVEIIYVDHEERADNYQKIYGAELEKYLASHGVKPTFHELERKETNVGLSLLEHARAHSIELLVMGGFCHSRLYDAMLGATTGHVIKNWDPPVLMSH